MKSKLFPICAAVAFMAPAFLSCNNGQVNNSDKNTNDTAQTITIPRPPRERVLTAAEQAALTPDEVIKSLKEGNERFVSSDITARDHSAMVRNAAAGQFPKAVILSCIDSRIPVEDVFDKGIGDMFVGRVAGNFVNTDLLGGMEFGCKVMGAKLILVLGHESCGAIKAAIDDVKLGNITAMLANIRPAVVASQDFAGDKTSKNDEFVHYVLKNNVINAIKTIKEKSPILKEMADSGAIKIVGAYYNIKTGAVTFLD
ncbi:carbonic anhydrase family protein [Taibaiella koreensis]|uniref:carbonic anhydrase family protein n=1 Tax=Taibaiella koreensis TaxID=1268548 RepID=UPI001969933B|nr:carbonic anhydrase family protein [Taibaiella koreensis]